MAGGREERETDRKSDVSSNNRKININSDEQNKERDLESKQNSNLFDLQRDLTNES